MLYTFDVPENTKSINIGFWNKTIKQGMPPTFFVPSFDQVPPRKK